MRLHLVSLSFFTLILALTSAFLPPTLSFSPSVAQAQTTPDRKAVADQLLEEGGRLRVNDNYEEALAKFEQALLIYQEIGDKAGVGETLHNIGYVYYSKQEYPQSLAYFQQALSIQQELGNVVWEEINLKMIRRVYDEQGTQLFERSQYREALEKFQQVLVIQKQLRELGKPELEAVTLNKIAFTYTYLGEYELALESYQKALVADDELRFLEDEWVILINMGELYQKLGQYELALKSYQEALELAKTPQADLDSSRNTKLEVRSLNAIGAIHYRLGQYELALDFHEQALALLKTIEDKTDTKLLKAATLNGIGLVYLKTGKPESALEFFQQAFILIKPLDDKPSEWAVLNNLGKAYYELGNYESAWDFFSQALVIAQKIGHKEGVGHALKNIGYLLEKQNQPELAIVFFKQSVNTREALRNNIKGLPSEFQQSYTETIAEDYRHLADLLLQQNRILEAQRVLDLLKVQELEDYLQNARGNNNTAQGIAERPQEQQIREGNEAILNRAIALGQELSQLESIPVSDRTQAQKQRVVELRKLEQEITQQFNKFLESPQVHAWIAQLQQTTGGQTVDLESYATTLQDNLKNLQQDAVILYPFILPDRLELVLVTPYTPPLRRTVPVKREELNRVITEFRLALGNPNRDATIPAQQLYNWLIKPIENDLAQAKTQTIIYAPDGQLRYIPLAALHDGNQWLVERFRINNITAVSLTDLNTKPQRQLHVLAAAFTQGNYRGGMYS